MASLSRWRIWATPLIAAVALAVIPYGATAVSPDAPGPSAVPNAWGWLVARRPATFAYVPAPLDQGNSGGYRDRVERVRLGDYYAFFDRIGNGFYPIGMVTALSAGARSCMIDDNFGNDVGGDPSLEMYCFDKDGQPADARFVANIVLGGDGPTGTLGYTWADQESTTDYAPSDYYSYLSSGAGPITVHRDRVGSYQVTMPGLGRKGGNAQVVAAGPKPAARCKVLALARDGSDELIRVRCRDVSGQLVDADFMVIFTDRVGLTGVPRRKAAYLLAHRPGAASYLPVARYRYSSTGNVSKVTDRRRPVSRDAPWHATGRECAGDGVRGRSVDLPGDQHPQGRPAAAHRGSLFRPHRGTRRQQVHAQLHPLTQTRRPSCDGRCTVAIGVMAGTPNTMPLYEKGPSVKWVMDLSGAPWTDRGPRG